MGTIWICLSSHTNCSFHILLEKGVKRVVFELGTSTLCVGNWGALWDLYTMWPIAPHTFMIVCGKANVSIEQLE